tara:strand:+ start:742 stop:1362 length:621 start_codon:yes stop_codon:yes gene_type:complete
VVDSSNKGVMKFNTQEDAIFFTPIWMADIEGVNNTSLKEYTYSLREKSPGTIISNRGGWHSSETPQPYPQSLVDLFGNIENFANTHCNEITKINDLVIGNWWININGKGNYNQIHDHQNSILSAVYYVDVPAENTGNLVVHRDDTAEYFLKKYRNKSPFSELSRQLVPATSRMYVMPSWTKHSVEQNQSDRERISIAINLISKKEL